MGTIPYSDSGKHGLVIFLGNFFLGAYFWVLINHNIKDF